MQSIGSTETYEYGTNKDLVKEIEDIKCNNIVKRYEKMISFDDVIKEEAKENNPNWSQIPGHLHRILIIRGSGFGEKIYWII